MNNLLQQKTEEIALWRAEKLNDIGKFYIKSKKEIDESLYIKKKWGLIEKWWYKKTLGYVPLTPYEEMIKKLENDVKEMEQCVKVAVNDLIKVLGEYK